MMRKGKGKREDGGRLSSGLRRGKRKVVGWTGPREKERGKEKGKGLGLQGGERNRGPGWGRPGAGLDLARSDFFSFF